MTVICAAAFVTASSAAICQIGLKRRSLEHEFRFNLGCILRIGRALLATAAGAALGICGETRLIYVAAGVINTIAGLRDHARLWVGSAGRRGAAL
jgi:hypothetical protein